MTDITQVSKAPISITECAAMQILNLIKIRNKPTFGIRIGVKTGGCAGFEYKMEYADQAECVDEVIVYDFITNQTSKYLQNAKKSQVEQKEENEVNQTYNQAQNKPTDNVENNIQTPSEIKILIGPETIIYLIGTKVDYSKNKFSSGFVFHNPSRKNTCGCGKSFNI